MHLSATCLIFTVSSFLFFEVFAQKSIQLGLNFGSKYLLTHYRALDDGDLFGNSDQKSDNTLGYVIFTPELSLTIPIKTDFSFEIAYEHQAFEPKIEINSPIFSISQRNFINPFETNIHIQTNAILSRLILKKMLNKKVDLEYGAGLGFSKSFASTSSLLDSSLVIRSENLGNQVDFILKFYELRMPAISYLFQSQFGFSYKLSKKFLLNAKISYDLGLNQYYFLKGDYIYGKNVLSGSLDPRHTYLTSRNDGFSLRTGISFRL